MADIMLKPCPFCGGEARRIANNVRVHGINRRCAWVYCPSCKVRTTHYRRDFDEHYQRSAADAWNRRTPEGGCE